MAIADAKYTRSATAARAAAAVLAASMALAGMAFAQQPTPAEQSAIKSACRGDYPSVCASVQPGGPAALHCLQENAARVSPRCQQALAAAGGASTPPAGGGSTAMMAPAPAGTAAAPPAMEASGSMPRMSPRDEMRLMREACGRDYRTYCQGVKTGGGHAITCLEANAASLTPGCRKALVAMKGRAGK